MFTEDDITQCMKDYSLTRPEAIRFLSQARRNCACTNDADEANALLAAGIGVAIDLIIENTDFSMPDFSGGGGDFGGGGSDSSW